MLHTHDAVLVDADVRLLRHSQRPHPLVQGAQYVPEPAVAHALEVDKGLSDTSTDSEGGL